MLLDLFILLKYLCVGMKRESITRMYMYACVYIFVFLRLQPSTTRHMNKSLYEYYVSLLFALHYSLLKLIPVVHAILAELSEEAELAVRKALQRGPNIVLSDAFKIKITRNDMATLSHTNWLNDEVKPPTMPTSIKLTRQFVVIT